VSGVKIFGKGDFESFIFSNNKEPKLESEFSISFKFLFLTILTS